MIEMEQVEQREPTPEEIVIGEKFTEITLNVIEAGKQYNELSPGSHQLFLNSMSNFLDFHRLINDNPHVDYTDQGIKLALFESVFGFDFSGTVENLIEARIATHNYSDGESTLSDEDINNADKDLLKNIKANIQDYLKD